MWIEVGVKEELRVLHKGHLLLVVQNVQGLMILIEICLDWKMSIHLEGRITLAAIVKDLALAMVHLTETGIFVKGLALETTLHSRTLRMRNMVLRHIGHLKSSSLPQGAKLVVHHVIVCIHGVRQWTGARRRREENLLEEQQ